MADFRFSVFQFKKKLKLLCYYEPKQTKIAKLITYISKKIGTYTYGKHDAILATDNSRYYFYNSRYPIQISDSYDMNKDFQEKATEILNSDFCQNIETNINIANTEVDCDLNIEWRGIDLYIREGNDKFQELVVRYMPYEDIVSIGSFDKKISNELVKFVLEIKIPREKLSNYHIGIIDTSETVTKNIKLEKTFFCKYPDFTIHEEEKQVVLSKIK